MGRARIRAISKHLPTKIRSNHDIQVSSPRWTASKIESKTGIKNRAIAADDETAADLAYNSALNLIKDFCIDVESIDFLLFCSQTPDFILPASACILQDRLGLRRDIGALDFSLGCSGFIYGLALAKGLIESDLASRVLVLTADTYSKLINEGDRSTLSLFGDAGTATLVESAESTSTHLGPMVFGTDGSGAGNLIVRAGAFRTPRSPLTSIALEDSSGNFRSDENLYMNGAEIMAFTLKEVPKAVERLLEKTGTLISDYDHFIFHQANQFILSKIKDKLGIDEGKFVIDLANTGNTVSSSIPIALEPYLKKWYNSGRRVMLVGFGVGYSWGATSVLL